jgi:Na+/H+ antiporter NhaD/arsenite permease-like protein
MQKKIVIGIVLIIVFAVLIFSVHLLIGKKTLPPYYLFLLLF